MTLQDFLDESANRAAKNRLLAGKPDPRRRTGDDESFVLWRVMKQGSRQQTLTLPQ